MNSIPNVPAPQNEPVLSYAPGSLERTLLKETYARMKGEEIEIPLIIGGREVRTGNLDCQVSPHNHGHVLARYHKAGANEVRQAVDAAMKAWKEWSNWPWEDRLAVFQRAADLLAGRWRPILNAATMLGQSKTAHQAEIDSACELIDFLRFNTYFAQQIYQEQPFSGPGMWNRLDHRPLEGFVYAITPFNFTAIAGNLPTAPAMLGNVAVWKPAATTVYSGYHIMRLLMEAGLPPGVINFVPGDPGPLTEVVLGDPNLAGIHFTGSTAVFQMIWRRVGENIDRYRTYPRLVGETGGKDFIVAHASADPEALATAIVRGGYEYQGQKCSAASRIYVPQSLWGEVRDRTIAMMKELKIGDVRDFRNFMGAVIDKKAFTRISEYLDDAKRNAKILQGGVAKGDKGFFIEPTLIQTEDPGYRALCEEIFGPVVTAYVYPDDRWEETLSIVDQTSPYALTGAIFSRDRMGVRQAMSALRNSAGNFYINDKPTGAVVGQQPFGGARGSGTNDKAGSKLNLVRWVSARTVKETFAPPRDYKYPFLSAE